jgi:hypothetical protein
MKMAITTFTPLFQMPGNNLLINGGFDIWQRGTSVTSTADVAATLDLADRWRRTVVGGGMSFSTPWSLSQQPVTAYGQGARSRYYYAMTLATGGGAPSATSHVFIENRIENGTLSLAGAGNQVTLSFLAYCGGAQAMTVGAALRQNYGTGGSAEEIIQGKGWTIPGTTQVLCTYTFTLNTLAAKTIQADNYLAVMIGFVWGTTPGAAYYNGATNNGCSPTSTGLNITQIKLESGGIATPYQGTDPSTELVRCQRYFRKFADGTATYAPIAVGQAASTTAAVIPIQLNPPMYKVPALTQKGNLALTKADSSMIPVTSLSVNATASTARVTQLSGGVAANLVAGGATVLCANNDVTGDIWLDAEI